MDENATDATTTELRQLARATRFTLLCIVLALSSIAIRICFTIGRTERIFEDMLGASAQLPLLTRLVLQFQSLLTILAVAVPAAAIGTLFMRNVPRAIHLLGIFLVVSIALGALSWEAIMSPLAVIISRMQGGPETAF